MLRILVQALKIGSIAVLALLVLGGAVRAFDYYRDQAAAEGKYGKDVVVTISKKDDTGEVADKLDQAGLINSQLYFEALVRISGKEIEPATYQLEYGMSTRTIVDLITTEKSTAKTENKELSITVIEGWLGFPRIVRAFLLTLTVVFLLSCLRWLLRGRRRSE